MRCHIGKKDIDDKLVAKHLMAKGGKKVTKEKKKIESNRRNALKRWKMTLIFNQK